MLLIYIDIAKGEGARARGSVVINTVTGHAWQSSARLSVRAHAAKK